MKLLLAASLAFLVFALAERAHAADPIQAEITAVDEQAGRLVITLNVLGADGRPAHNLTAANFRPTLDGIPLNVPTVSNGGSNRGPIAVLLLVDVSGSMQGDPIDQAKKAMVEFLKGLGPGDQVAVLAFDTNIKLLQDFSADRTAVTQGINKLAAVGDTALYDAVIEATRRSSLCSASRKLIVLLSDGEATLGKEKRPASIDAARKAGVAVVTIGLGKGIDRDYLKELATVSGGRFLEAPTPAALRQSYTDLAASIQSQYVITLSVPSTVDRSVPGNLSLKVTIGQESVVVERALPALAGAAPRPLEVIVEGLAPGQRLGGVVLLKPALADGAVPVAVEYSVDGEPVATLTTGVLDYSLDPASYSPGNHLVKVAVTDSRERKGERELYFVIPAPGGASHQLPVAPIAIAVAALALAGLIPVAIRRRRAHAEEFASRVKPWADRGDAPAPKALWPSDEEVPAAVTRPSSRQLGRVVVMDEGQVRSGSLGGIQEYEIGANSLSLGSGRDCDIVLLDEDGQIALEEARLWVQKGRLVYHRLTTLSAMAIEGVASGWEVLDSGEEIRVGRYRVAFQADEPRESVYEEPAAPEPV